LIYADAEAPDNEELGARHQLDWKPASIETNLPYLAGSFYHPLGDLGLAANTNGVVVADLLDEIILAHRLGVVIDFPSIGLEGLNGVWTDVF
jgi:hypothetical protein